MSSVSSHHERSSRWPVWVILVVLVGSMLFVAAEGKFTASQVARIAGRLTLEGRPIRQGHSVVFMEPSRGDLAFGMTDAEGSFVVNSWKNGEMVPGRYKAYVVPPSVRPDNLPGFRFNEGFLVKLPAEHPDEYIDVNTTPLIYDVEVGENRFEIDLERKAAPSTTEETPTEDPPESSP